MCKRSICPIYTCQGKSTDAEGWKLDYVKSIQPLAIRYLEKLKLSQESLSDEVSLFQQLLKFFSFASNTRLLLLLFGNDNHVGCGKGAKWWCYIISCGDHVGGLAKRLAVEA